MSERKTTWLLTPALCAWLFVAVPGPLAAGQPTMDFEGSVTCMPGPAGESIIQCREHPKGTCRCLISDGWIKDSAGKRTDRRMERLPSCTEYVEAHYAETLRQSGCDLTPGRPGAPPGYGRDDKGQLFQTTFDLRKRLFVGLRWAPLFDLDGESLERAGIDFGFDAYDLNYGENRRHRFRVVEGEFSLAPVDFAMTTFAYDLNTRREEPALWLTTFIGSPRRFDLNFDLGWSLRLLSLDHRPMRSTRYTELENAAIFAAWDIYNGKRLANSLRVAVGPGCGELFSSEEGEEARFVFYPEASLLGRFALGRRGLHHLGFDLAGQLRYYADEIGRGYYQGRGRLFYEWVLMALNDQPISLYLEGSARYRDDLADLPQPLEFRSVAGLRFSFWAPVLEE